MSTDDGHVPLGLTGYLKSLFHKAQFQPTFLSFFINPHAIARNALYRAIKSLSPNLGGNILDVGCGQKPYRQLFRCESYVGLEFDSSRSRAWSKAEFFYDGKVFPFPGGNFDSLICSQVLEHVPNPREFLREAHRVLKPGGKVLLTVPFVWEEHEQPYDFARYTTYGMEHLLQESDFVIKNHIKTAPNLSCIIQLVAASLTQRMTSRFRLLNVILCLVMSAPVNFCGWVCKALGSNPNLYLDHVYLLEKRPESLTPA